MQSVIYDWRVAALILTAVYGVLYALLLALFDTTPERPRFPAAPRTRPRA